VWVGYVLPVGGVFISLLRRHRPPAPAEPAATASASSIPAAANLSTGRTQ
jgi:hypothetical protein